MKLYFAGIECTPGNLKGETFKSLILSDRVYILGGIYQDFDWENSSDVSLGFESFITYVGVRSIEEGKEIQKWLVKNGGCFYDRDKLPTPSHSHNREFPWELKVRNLSARFIRELVNKW